MTHRLFALGKGGCPAVRGHTGYHSAARQLRTEQRLVTVNSGTPTQEYKVNPLSRATFSFGESTGSTSQSLPSMPLEPYRSLSPTRQLRVPRTSASFMRDLHSSKRKHLPRVGGNARQIIGRKPFASQISVSCCQSLQQVQVRPLHQPKLQCLGQW